MQTTTEIPIIPLEDFFKNPDKEAYQLSPNGEYYAYMAPYQDRMNIFVQKVGEEESMRLTSETDRGIYWFFWANNDRVIYLKDSGGDENIALYGVNIDGTNYQPLTEIEGVKTEIIDELSEVDGYMLVGLNQRNPQIFDPYRLNINTGELELLFENPGNISEWMTDHDGVLRLAITTDGVNKTILYRESEESDFQPVLTTSFKDAFMPQFFEFDNSSTIYAISNIGRNYTAAVKFDLENAREIEEIYIREDYDIERIGYSKKRKELTAVYWYADSREEYFFDEPLKHTYEVLHKHFPEVEVGIASLSKEEDKMIIRTYSDKTRGAYYLYDTKTEEVTYIDELSPWLDVDQMASMQPISYTSRDGWLIHGYLTLPEGVEAKNLPVIVNPHGGPWHRDRWGFNPQVQFFANRGYAVLQMNFRGSTGFGREFWEISFKQWGQTMQNDITDGAQWLIDEGIADPDRLAIYGGSYGGYATLAGLTYTPDLYACGIDYVGVSNLFTFIETIPPYWEPYREMLHEMVGHPEEDSAMLAAYSPALNAELIQAPLFIAQGANDPRVKQSESDQMVAAMKERGVEVEYMIKEDEGHGFYNEENRFDFYRAVEEFLHKHL